MSLVTQASRWKKLWLAVTPAFFVACLLTPSAARAEDLSLEDAEEEAGDGSFSIAEELEKGVDLLDQEIAKQEQQRGEVQTDRERQLLQEHLAFLNNERKSLLRLLNLLVGPRFNSREAAREHQRELQYERTQKQLDRDERFPAP